MPCNCGGSVVTVPPPPPAPRATTHQARTGGPGLIITSCAAQMVKSVSAKTSRMASIQLTFSDDSVETNHLVDIHFGDGTRAGNAFSADMAQKMGIVLSKDVVKITEHSGGGLVQSQHVYEGGSARHEIKILVYDALQTRLALGTCILSTT